MKLCPELFAKLFMKEWRYRGTLFYGGVVLIVLGFIGQTAGSWPGGVISFRAASADTVDREFVLRHLTRLQGNRRLLLTRIAARARALHRDRLAAWGAPARTQVGGAAQLQAAAPA